ncbi:MAG: nodulation protein NfeD [Anaerolineales bacterium]
MKPIRYKLILVLVLFTVFSFAFQTAHAQSDEPLVIVLTADGPIMPPMLEYFKRGIQTAERENAEALVIQLKTPGGSLDTMFKIIDEIRASNVPVVVYVSPKGAYAGSAGAPITFSAHASAMAPDTFLGASTPINETGENLNSDAKAKASNATKAKIREFVQPRGEEALKLAESMVDEAAAATADEALKVGLVDFVVDNVDDLLESLDGFTVSMDSGPRTLHTAHAHTESLMMTFIEQLLLFITNPNIVFSLLSVGTMAILIEISSPGGWVAGFLGVVCIMVALYGTGMLSVNWFGSLFLVTAFVLFILDIKAPTHGALTAAGVTSFIIGALVLFNSPGVPQFQRVSVPLVISVGIFLGLLFFGILMLALRAQHTPIKMGAESYIGMTGTAKIWHEATGQVQVDSELWSAEKAEGSESIRKGDGIEVVKMDGLKLVVRKK